MSGWRFRNQSELGRGGRFKCRRLGVNPKEKTHIQGVLGERRASQAEKKTIQDGVGYQRKQGEETSGWGGVNSPVPTLWPDTGSASSSLHSARLR